jgi:hypothetical protein
MTVKPITDKAEVSIDFPDKAYIGAFTRHSGFEAEADAEGVALKLVRAGEDRRVVEMHIHYYLFADILEELARAIGSRPPIDEAHRGPLLDAARRLARSLARRRPAPTKR